MSPQGKASSTRLDTTAMGILLVLCASWGMQQVTIKVANAGVSPVLQAGIRSIGATVLLWFWMQWRRQPLFERDGTLWWGVAVGIGFAAEFMLIYWGLEYTNASRAVVFLYTMPFYTAIGAQLFIPAERLRPLQVLGLLLAFAGIVVAFGESLTMPTRRTLVGDGMALGAAGLWGLCTVMIKASRLSQIRPAKTLFYQLAVSALALPLFSLALGEAGIVRITPLIGLCLVYQIVWVAFITYLIWFWLIKHYPASRLAAFVFFTPLFGVLFGAGLLNEPLTLSLLTALVLVGSGIFMVNHPAPMPPGPGERTP